MFELIWDLARGPAWLRVIQVVLLVAAVVALLVNVVYPEVYAARVESVAV